MSLSTAVNFLLLFRNMVAESKKGTEKVEKMEVDEVKKAEPAPKDLNAIALDSTFIYGCSLNT